MPESTTLRSRIVHAAAEDAVVHGVAIGEDDLTRGKHGPKRWPREVLEPAAASLEGQPIVHNFDDPAEHRGSGREEVGEVVQAAYEPGVGVVYEARLTDEEVAAKLSRGELEVSIEGEAPPDAVETDPETGAAVLHEFSFTGMAAVLRGASPSNYTAPGEADANPGIAALSAGDIQTALQRSQARTPDYSGTESGEWDSPSLGDYVRGYESVSDDVSQVSDLTQDERSLIASKTLLGEAGAETFDNLSFFPVVDPANDNLNERALRAVLGGRGSQADISSETLESARRIARGLLQDEFDADVAAEEAAAGDAAASVGDATGEAPEPDDSADADEVSGDTAASSTMTDDETDEGSDEPTVDEVKATLADVREERDELEAQLAEKKEIIEEQQEEIETVRLAYAEAIVDEDGPLEAAELAEKFDVVELREKFEAAEDAALAEESDPEPDVASGGGEGEAGEAALSEDEQAELERLKEKRAALANTAAAPRIDERIAELEEAK